MPYRYGGYNRPYYSRRGGYRRRPMRRFGTPRYYQRRTGYRRRAGPRRYTRSYTIGGRRW